MFNPYSVRPIGTERFNQHLIDVFTSVYYRTPDISEEPPKPPVHGWGMWQSSDPDPYLLLACAIIADAIVDYVKYYAQRENSDTEGDYILWDSRCLRLENEYFRRNDFAEEIFNQLLIKLHDADKKNTLNRTCKEIARRCGQLL